MLGACATVDSAKAPDANVKGLKSFYVTRVPEDERGIEKIIAARLSAMGYAATSGDAPQPPDHVDAVVTYLQRKSPEGMVQEVLGEIFK
jgi:hypothetical protein